MVEVTNTIKRGSAELAVLAVLEERALHGYEIARKIRSRTRGVLHFNLASLYPLLYRMEKQRLIAGAWETTTAGRRRRCYRLTAAGRKRLAPLRAEWKLLFRALNRLAGVADA